MKSTTSLGETCRFVGGGTPSRKIRHFWSGQIPWATVKDFRDDRISHTDEYITQEGLDRSASKLVPSGTVLLVTRVGLGKVAIADVDLAINQDVKAIFPSEELLPEFLFWILKQLGPEIERMGTGATVKGITLQDVRKLKIPLPLLDEQQRIVNILNRATKIERLRRQAQERLREFIPALFVKMFGDNERIKSSYPCMPLRDVAAIVSGATKGRKIDPGQALEVPYLRVANVQEGFLNLDEVKTIRIRKNEENRYALEPGDLVMTEGGDSDKLGRAAVWNGELPYCAHQNHIFRVRPNREVVLTDYLRDVAGSSYGKSYFLSVAKRTTGIASINKTQIGGFPVPIPPIDLQIRYCNIITRMRRVADTAIDTTGRVFELSSSLMNRSLKVDS